MRPDEFDGRMRALELFHVLRLPPGAWVILRLDGRGFSRFTETRFEKPFDPRFHDAMVQTTQTLLEDLQGRYAYTESDEISVSLPRTWDLFDRELEKAVSLSAGLASATFSLACGTRAHFDSRAVLAAEDEQVVDYFRWRQADATRCALNGWAYWTLRKAGQGVAEATAALKGKSVADKNELLFRAGINFNDLPLWQRRGAGLYWERHEREGYNPKSGQKVATTRRRIKVDRELPMGEEYADFVGRLLRQGMSARQ
ncbi:MAG TPA: tRNA(His) guanylyltransferase Thg1 family protein [Gemmataceae bacterium]|nr:tRNA(His) guanylyltransferase Thg1 family protein [Gemmataceae bacterium]